MSSQSVLLSSGPGRAKRPVVTVEDLIRRIESRVSSAAECAVEDALSACNDELVEAIRAETETRESAAGEVARVLRAMPAHLLPPAAAQAVDAVLRALEGEPIDLMLLPQRIARTA